MSKLRDKKYRKESALFRFDGVKLFLEAVSTGVDIRYIVLRESSADKLKLTVEKEAKLSADARFIVVSDAAFDKLTEEKSPEGIVCVASPLDKLHKAGKIDIISNEAKERILLLESVRDAGNLGTIVRCARAFGIDRLVISSDCADLYNAKTLRAAMGAIFTQRIDIVDSIAESVAQLRLSGYRVLAAALDGNAKRLGSFELGLGDVILIGNEGHGLSDGVRAACNESVFIPMEKGAESLNAAIAASVCMWELYKSQK